MGDGNGYQVRFNIPENNGHPQIRCDFGVILVQGRVRNTILPITVMKKTKIHKMINLVVAMMMEVIRLSECLVVKQLQYSILIIFLINSYSLGVDHILYESGTKFGDKIIAVGSVLIPVDGVLWTINYIIDSPIFYHIKTSNRLIEFNLNLHYIHFFFVSFRLVIQ